MNNKWLYTGLIAATWALGLAALHANAQQDTKADKKATASDSKSEKADSESKKADSAAKKNDQPTDETAATGADVPLEESDVLDVAESTRRLQIATLQVTEQARDLKIAADTVWTLLAGFLVFWMNAGFGCVEAGFCRSKNAVNILGKNFVVFGISSLAFWGFGFGIMFGDGNKFMGLEGWAVNAEKSFSSLDWAGIPLLAKFFFQLAFAATAATIVSGCVAERIHYKSYMLFVIPLVALGYPLTGHWIWGGGWLYDQGFRDFAGSTVVHSVGGWAGLVGILILGPRLGKYQPDGSIRPIPGHSMALAFLGGLILWLGWFGFNPGSTMAADANAISHIVVTTNLAAAAGLLAATLIAWIKLGTPDFSMTVNGALAGLVAITAPCAYVTPVSAIAIGAVAGVIVVYSVLFFDKMKIDDPVGALSVHLVNGIWGTLAVGLFAFKESPGGIEKDGLLFGGGMSLLTAQAIGIVAVGGFTVVFSAVFWMIIKSVCGLRVEESVEQAGLDISEMGMEAYPDIQKI